MIEIHYAIVVAGIIAPAVVVVVMIYFVRDMVQMRGMRDRDKERSEARQFDAGANAVMKLVPEIHRQLNGHHHGAEGKTGK